MASKKNCLLYQFFCAKHSAPKVYLCTYIYICDYQVVGVEHTTERITVIDRPVTVSCPLYASTKMFKSNESNRGSSNLSSTSS